MHAARDVSGLPAIEAALAQISTADDAARSSKRRLPAASEKIAEPALRIEQPMQGSDVTKTAQ
jgi:hypothetical protein